MADNQTEIEIKYRLPNQSTYDSILKQIFLQSGIRFESSFYETNVILDDIDGNLKMQDCVLRVRHEAASPTSVIPSNKITVTYKGPASEENGIKSRYELNVPANKDILTLLTLLGYKESVRYEKFRISYVWTDENNTGTCHICLDNLPNVGFFVEIEGPNENAIRSSSKLLGLNSPEIVVEKRSYPSIIRDVKNGKA